MDEYIRIRRGFLAEITLCHRVITLRKTAAPCKEDRRTRGCGRMVCGRWAGRVTPCHTRSPSPSPSATLSWTMLSVLYPPPQAEIPGSDALEKKFNCRPAASTLRDKRPFDKHVEGLSYYRAKRCVIKPAVQKHAFENTTLCRHNRTSALRASRRVYPGGDKVEGEPPGLSRRG
jgi:hypothetical protein